MGDIGLAERKQRKAMERASREKLQRLLSQEPSTVAQALDRRCPHCRALLVPAIETYRAPWLAEGIVRHAAFPPCSCPGAQHERAQAADEARQAEARAQRARHAAALAAAGLSGVLAECSFASFEHRPEWPEADDLAAAVQDYVAACLAGTLAERPWLVMYGHYGTGKTHLAAAAIHEAVSHGVRDCYFRSWTRYLERIKASWDGGHERAAEIVAELQRGRLVAIDDLDKARDPSGWARETLYAILDARCTARLPTILTFNYAPTEPDPEDPERVILERFMSLAVIDRVLGASWAQLHFEGGSHRSAVAWAVQPPARAGRR